MKAKPPPRKPSSKKRAAGGANKQTLPPPPQTYQSFIERFPKLGQAWDLAHEAGEDGPLDARVQRLVKLAVAVGALREGAVRSAARKARATGISEAEIAQTVALAAGTLGFPATVAVFSWILGGDRG